jgi:hypothetical protein
VSLISAREVSSELVEKKHAFTLQSGPRRRLLKLGLAAERRPRCADRRAASQGVGKRELELAPQFGRSRPGEAQVGTVAAFFFGDEKLPGARNRWPFVQKKTPLQVSWPPEEDWL